MTQEQNNIILTDRERDILIGSILGDGTMQKRGNSYRMRIAHSINQHEYLIWMRKELDRLCDPDSEGAKIKTYTSKDGKNITEYFYLRSGLYLKPLYDLFYKEINSEYDLPKQETAIPDEFDLTDEDISQNKKFRKSITRETIENLPRSNVMLAVWFLDDGNARDDCFAGKLCTQGFNKDENNLLVEYLIKYNIKAKVDFHSIVKKQYYISIPAVTFGHLVKEIAPIVKQIPSMEYKLNKERQQKSKNWKHLDI